MKTTNNPHPEAREEDIETTRKALIELRSYAERLDCDYQEECTPGCDDLCPRCKAVFIADEALDSISRLAAPKPEGQDIIRCEITAGEYPDRISVKPPAGTFERGLVVMGAMVDLVFRPAAPEPRPAEEPAPNNHNHSELLDALLDELEGERYRQGKDWPDIIRARVEIATLRSQLARKDEGLREALKKIAALDYSRAATNGAAYDAVQIARAALREPDGKE